MDMVIDERDLVTRSKDSRIYYRRHNDDTIFFILRSDAGLQQAKDGSWATIDLWERWQWIRQKLTLAGTIHPDAFSLEGLNGS